MRLRRGLVNARERSGGEPEGHFGGLMGKMRRQKACDMVPWRGPIGASARGAAPGSSSESAWRVERAGYQLTV